MPVCEDAQAIGRAPPRSERRGDEALDDDDALMMSFQAGDVAALEVLFDRHAARIRAVMLRMTANEALAMDLTQTTFLSVVRGKARFVAKSRFVPWLYTIAMNALRDHHRRARREVLTPDGEPPERAWSDLTSDPGLEQRVQRALQRLPTDQREAVVLHQLEGFAFKEIARMTGVSPSAVKVRAHRGYAKMRRELEDIWAEVVR